MRAYIKTNTESILFPFALTAINGKYGYYSKINTINRSDKWLTENGYELRDITKDEFTKLQSEYLLKCREAETHYRQLEINKRIESVINCLKCKPIEIRLNSGEICVTASLSESAMIDYYRGCGKGTAFIKNNKLYAFHYGYDLPEMKELKQFTAIKIELSGTQICFI